MSLAPHPLMSGAPRPLELPPTAVAAFGSGRVFALRLGSAAAFAALCASPQGLQALGVSTRLIVGLCGWYAVDAALAWAFARHIATGARWAWARGLLVLSLTGLGFAYGAASAHPASLAWTFVVPTMLPLAQLCMHRAPAILLLGAALPVALRLLLCPAPSLESLGVAAAVGGAWAAALWAMSWRFERRALAQASSPLGRAEADARAALLRALMPALRLHDELSGATCVLQLRLGAAKDWTAVAAAVDAYLTAAAPWLEPHRPGSWPAWLAALGGFAQATGSALSARVDAAKVAALSSELQGDVAHLAWEACVNLLREPGTRLCLTVDVGPEDVTVRAEAPGAAAPRRGGRGVRNMRLRAWARGGTLRVTADADARRLVAQLPSEPTALPAGLRGAGAALLVLAPLAWLGGSSAPVFLFIVSGLVGCIAQTGVALEARAYAEACKVPPPRLAQLTSALGQLRRAADERSLPAARSAVAQVASEISLALADAERAAPAGVPVT